MYFLSPVKSYPREHEARSNTCGENLSWSQLVQHFPSIKDADTVAFDFETDGTHIGCKVVGIGLAWKESVAYVPFTLDNQAKVKSFVKNLVKLKASLVAHNLFFDGRILYTLLGKCWPDRQFYDTYAIYKHLAAEGFLGQKWGLKAAMVDLLGWPDSNEAELDNWLIENGFTKGRGKDIKADKSQMFQAPSHILGRYCNLDADATYQIFTRVLKPAADNKAGPAYWQYFNGPFMSTLVSLIQSTVQGMHVYADKLAQYYVESELQILDLKNAFLNNEEVAWVVEEYNQKILKESLDRQPPPVTKSNRISKTWMNWLEKHKEKMQVKSHFNLNSGDQLRWLFFDRLGHTPVKQTVHGEASVDRDSLGSFGQPGKLLLDYNNKTKEMGFTEAYLTEHIKKSPYTKDDRVHFGWNVPGTLTGRLSGKNPNCQQLPKSAKLLACFGPPEGKVWIDLDIDSLEQVVLAELSKDPALWKLYGPGAPIQDVYLFTGAKLPVIGEKIRRYYDPESPSSESIAEAKKHAKKERSISKVVVLSSSYGAGPAKIHSTLRLQGVDVSFEEAKEIHSGYWEVYSGVKKFQRKLEKEWEERGGWIRNGVGRPIPVAEDYLKDITNRCIQSTGHDCLMWYIDCITRTIPADLFDWVIPDWHDESIIECKEENADQVRSLMEKDCLDLLNEELGGEIPLTGEAKIVHNLAEAKCEE